MSEQIPHSSMRNPAAESVPRQGLIAKLRRAFGQMTYLPRALSLVWAAARPWTVAWGMLLAVQGGLPVVSVALTRALVDSLVATLDAPGDSARMRSTLVLVAATAGVVLVGQMLRSVTELVRTSQSERVQDHILGLIHEVEQLDDEDIPLLVQ